MIDAYLNKKMPKAGFFTHICPQRNNLKNDSKLIFANKARKKCNLGIES